MIAIITEDKPFKFITNDDLQIIIPDNLIDLQNFTETLWNKIFNENEGDKIDLYNKAAKIYNEKVKFQAITILNNKKWQKLKKLLKKSHQKKL